MLRYVDVCRVNVGIDVDVNVDVGFILGVVVIADGGIVVGRGFSVS